MYSTVNSMAASLYFIDYNPVNPVQFLFFCMLLRKHIQGSCIVSVEQKGSERIIEISLEVLNELGFTASKKLIFEIMGKHSNIILVDTDTDKVIDSIKCISIDVNRSRQILPGKTMNIRRRRIRFLLRKSRPMKSIIPEVPPNKY